MRTFILTFLWLSLTIPRLFGHGTHPFPEYTPENIATQRLEYARQGRYEEGIAFLRHWQESQGTPKTQKDSSGWYAMQAAIAYTFFDLRELDSAEVILKPVLDISLTRFPAEYLRVQNAWGVRLIYGGKFTDARKHYEKIRALFDSGQLTAKPDQYANTIHNLGVANSQLGDYDAALEVFHHIEDFIIKHDVHDNRLEANLQLNLAGANSQLGQDETSLVHSRKAYAICVEEYGTDHPFTAQTLNSVANGIRQTGNHEEALATYMEVLAVYERIDRQEHPLRSLALLNAAETLDKMGRSQEAIQYLDPCIAIRKKAYGMRHSEVARAYKAKGTILGHLDQYDEALLSLDTALMALGYDAKSENPYSGVDAMFNLFYTLDHRADVYYDQVLKNPSQENLEAAREAYVQGIQVLNDLRVHFKGKLSKGNLNHKSYMFYEPAINVCLQLYEKTGDEKDLEQALQWSSESKGNDFYDLIRGENAMVSAKVPDSIRTHDDQFQQDLAELESTWYDAEENDKTKARQALDERKREYRTWLGTIETRYPKYYDLLYADAELNSDARRTDLAKSGSQLIEYFVGDTNAFAFLLTPKSIHSVRLGHPKRIEEAVLAWRDQVSVSSEEAQKTLSELIWQPLAPFLSNEEHVIIIPDGILSSVPFEILQQEDGKLVLDSYFISYDYSSRNAALVNTPNKNQRWLGVAPSYDTDGGSLAMASRGLDTAYMRLRDVEWLKLPGAEAEVQAIGALTGGEKRIGKSATERFFSTMANQFGILHLSMHAWTDDDEPLLSTLIFSNEKDSVYDGRLYAHEIFQLDLPARLAVLSACNTGVGAFRRGEGISSLARAFMYAGTEATVMSLWKVPDESTAAIMKAFYEHLRKGERKDEALRHAKQDYLKSVTEPELKKPYYWAGFVLMGNTSPIYGGGFPVGIAGIIGGVLLLGGLFLWMRRKRKDISEGGFRISEKSV